MIYKRLNNFLKNLSLSASDQNGKLILLCVLDIVWCRIYYGMAIIEYSDFGFPNINRRKYKTYFTQRDNQYLIHKSSKVKDLFSDKKKLYNRLYKLFNRVILPLSEATKEDVLKIVYSCNGVIIKPRNLRQGRNIKKIYEEDLKTDGFLTELLSSKEKKNWLLEEEIIQHNALTEAFGPGVFPIRIITVRSNQKSKAIFAAVTIGRGGISVNYHTEGIMLPVNLETGVVIGPGLNKYDQKFEIHPETNTAFDGFQIPRWNDVLKTALSAAELCPEIIYAGWDIAVTNDGAVIIEGNTIPGTYRLVQNQIYTSKIGGIKPLFEGYL